MKIPFMAGDVIVLRNETLALVQEVAENAVQVRLLSKRGEWNMKSELVKEDDLDDERLHFASM